MGLPFMDWLEKRTRDAILRGAAEAGKVLTEGAEVVVERTEVVVTLERMTEYESTAGADRPGLVEASGPPDAKRALPPSGRGPAAGKREAAPKAGPPARGRQPEPGRTPATTSKTEAMFDASPGSKP